MAAVALDLGRQRALEAERLRAFRESARQVAHEIKNPLTPIRFAIERLRRGTGPELADAVDVLATETERLERTARSFAQFGRLPGGTAVGDRRRGAGALRGDRNRPAVDDADAGG